MMFLINFSYGKVMGNNPIKKLTDPEYNLFLLAKEAAEETGFIKYTKNYYGEWIENLGNSQYEKRILDVLEINNSTYFCSFQEGVLHKYNIELKDAEEFFYAIGRFVDSILSKLELNSLYISLKMHNDLNNKQFRNLQALVKISNILSESEIPHWLTSKDRIHYMFQCYEHNFEVRLLSFTNTRNASYYYRTAENEGAYLIDIDDFGSDEDYNYLRSFINVKMLSGFFGNRTSLTNSLRNLELEYIGGTVAPGYQTLLDTQQKIEIYNNQKERKHEEVKFYKNCVGFHAYDHLSYKVIYAPKLDELIINLFSKGV